MSEGRCVGRVAHPSRRVEVDHEATNEATRDRRPPRRQNELRTRQYRLPSTVQLIARHAISLCTHSHSHSRSHSISFLSSPFPVILDLQLYMFNSILQIFFSIVRAPSDFCANLALAIDPSHARKPIEPELR